MELLNILETFGLPIAMSVAFGVYIWKQNTWIQDTCMSEMDENAKRLEAIIIGLINAQKKLSVEMRGLEKSYKAIVDIIAKLEAYMIENENKRK
tara:strand:- start:404 stop:685 length:282 start_codon:yes stop_codon:yes gene_type:complete